MAPLLALLLLAQASATQLRQAKHVQSTAINLLYGLASSQADPRNATAGELESWQFYRPCAACKEYVRMGSFHDGGYVMCGELLTSAHATAAYSYGINGRDTWGEQVSQRLNGTVVEQYDCFNLGRPACHAPCKFEFHEECIAAKNEEKDGRRFSTLRNNMLRNGHLHGDAADMVLKMDVEGAEWGVLSADDAKDVLRRFSQVVLEFHGAQALGRTKALQNLLDLFDVVHIHANNCCKPLETAEGFVVPKLLEVTFVRKGLAEKQECDASPEVSPLDHRNLAGRGPHPQIKLGL